MSEKGDAPTEMIPGSTRRRPVVAAGIAALAVLCAGVSVAAAPARTGSSQTADGGSAGAVEDSASWSGYVVTSRLPMTYVSAQWVVANVTCLQTSSTQATVHWVGLDGWFDKTVEQGGTEAYCSGVTATYTAWWEMYPTNQITQVFPVRMGDHMTASVSFTNGVFTITLLDSTSRRSFTVSQRCSVTAACRRSSAEWIAEAPAYHGHGANLVRWNRLTFTNALASTSANHAATSVSTFTNFPVVMTGVRGRRAQPAPLVPGGESFTEIWISPT